MEKEDIIVKLKQEGKMLSLKVDEYERQIEEYNSN